MKIIDKINEIKRLYKYIDSNLFLYNKELDKKRYFNKITCYYFLNDIENGYWIFKFIWYDKKMNYSEWVQFLEMDSIKILTELVLPKQNLKYGTNWQYKDLIGWTWTKIKDDYRKHNKKYHG
jgi:hypothetical protein